MDEVDLGDVELTEHPLIINLKYRLGPSTFDMLYHKDKDKVARFLSAEFPLVAYVSRGKVWASGLDEQGKQQSQVVFI